MAKSKLQRGQHRTVVVKISVDGEVEDMQLDFFNHGQCRDVFHGYSALLQCNVVAKLQPAEYSSNQDESKAYNIDSAHMVELIRLA